MDRRRLVSANDAIMAKRQHRIPCFDCPWRRNSLPGWLGSNSVDDWVHFAHGETQVECHTRLGAQCAGVAIYRANVAKQCRDESILRLPRDKTLVFDSPTQFRKHHTTIGRT